MSKKNFYLSDLIEEKYIIKDGTFQNIGSAKQQNQNNVLCYAINIKYIKIADTNPSISAIITLPTLQTKTSKPLVIHEEPDILFGKIVNKLILQEKIEPNMHYGISESSSIDPSAYISPKTYIGKNVKIGRNAIVNDYTIIEDGCIVGDNVVLGCEGFYFKRDKEGKIIKFLHAGGVHLKQNVEIMTGSMVQKAHDLDFTTIEEGTKISVNVNIGHSSFIGKHNMITGNVQIAGRVKMGDYCWVGTSSTISDSVQIGDNVKIYIGSVVVKNVRSGEEVSGNFAYNHIRRVKNFTKEQKQ